LAREATRDDVDLGNSIASKSLGGKGSDVFILRNLRPMFRQYAAGERLNLAERYGLKAARALKAKAKAAYAAEKIKHTQLGH
jgi:hypothetical protein